MSTHQPSRLVVTLDDLGEPEPAAARRETARGPRPADRRGEPPATRGAEVILQTLAVSEHSIAANELRIAVHRSPRADVLSPTVADPTERVLATYSGHFVVDRPAAGEAGVFCDGLGAVVFTDRRIIGTVFDGDGPDGSRLGVDRGGDGALAAFSFPRGALHEAEVQSNRRGRPRRVTLAGREGTIRTQTVDGIADPDGIFRAAALADFARTATGWVRAR